MATVNLKFSQNVIDQWQSIAQQEQGVAGSFAKLVTAVDAANAYVDANFANASWNQTGSTIVVNYPNGATETYTDVVQDNPAASSGHASVGGYAFHQNGVVTMTVAGQFNYDYTLTPSAGNSLSFSPSAQGSTLQYFRVATEAPQGSAGYDPVFGNTAITLNGALRESANGDLSGAVHNITIGADNFLASSSLDGNFVIDASQPGGIGGSLTAYQETYRDGSMATLAGANVVLNPMQNVWQDLLSNATYYGGNDDISIDLPARLPNAVMLDAGAGDDRVALKGGGGQLGVAAGDGNDRITLLDNGHNVDGGSGLDTVVLAGARSQVAIHRAAPGQPVYTVTDGAGNVDTLTNVERLLFADGSAYALDVDGNAGAAYRIYQAAFNRTPDAGGLSFWINALDHGQSATSVAQGFMTSAEFQQAYGAAPAHLDLVTKFYQNILHRAPDSGGLSFWVNALDTHAAGVADVLAAISESAENRAALVGAIGDGFAYTPYGQA